ncbi:methylaspartate mutase subunit E [bacterium]|nr:MAG: methylaspartate mutase subunit E [bacterium]
MEPGVWNRRLSEDVFAAQRTEVLAQWPTGASIDLDEAVDRHHAMPPSKNVSRAVASALGEGRTLIQPRGGVATVDGQIELLRGLQEAGADLLPTTLDSYTRNCRFTEAQEGLRASLEQGRSLLNGFPVVNHGVDGCRRVVDSVELPLVGRPGAPDARLAAEVALAAGYSDFEGGPLDYFFAYTKDTRPEHVIAWWQYIYRLAGYYESCGVPIHQEQYGSITGTLVPPSLALAVVTVEAIMAAEQGVRHVGLGYGQEGCLVQDVAALRVYPQVARRYLDRLGYAHVRLGTVMNQWMGAFPSDEAAAMGVIGWGAVTAAFGHATEVITKSPHEAEGIPTIKANAEGIRCTRQLLNMLRHQAFPDSELLAQEMEIIDREASAVLDRILDFGDGDVAAGVVRAIDAGVLEIPFSPSKHNRGRILPARDAMGAVRLLDFGNLPFPDDVKEFHRSRILCRGARDGKAADYHMVIEDVYAISHGHL